MKKIVRIALALFVGAVIICEPRFFGEITSTAIEVFGKEAAKIEAKKK